VAVTGDTGGKKWNVNSGSSRNAAAIIYDEPLMPEMPDPSGIHLF
jgi:hypothetical protein